jgi:hypothetical protein
MSYNNQSTLLTENRHSGGYEVSAANGERSYAEITVLMQSGTALTPAGTILGETLVGTSATYAANAGNTGNFTSGTVTVGEGALEGTYRGEFSAPTAFNIFDPNGELVGEGHTGTAFTGEGMGFTITAGGTAAVAGDGFTLALAANANVGLYAPLSLTAADGTQNVAGILYNTMDLTKENTLATITARASEVNGSELFYPSGASASQIAAINVQLAALGIIVR